jgi:hypothetical protein
MLLEVVFSYSANSIQQEAVGQSNIVDKWYRSAQMVCAMDVILNTIHVIEMCEV